MSYFQKTATAKEIEDAYKRLYGRATGVVPPTVVDEGYVKPGGWGGDTKNPKKWKVVNMKDDPKLFKVVDRKGKNIAANFMTKAGAQAFIDKAIKLSQEDGDPDPDAPEVPPIVPDVPPTTPPPQGTFTGPYAGIGPILQSSTRGPTERHYNSGKDSDWTIEKNVHNIKAKNHQFVSYVTMNKIEHDDTISHKGGGRHMEEGWLDHTVGFEDGQTGLGTERKHPDYDLIQEGAKIGSVLGKKIGVATAYFTDINHSELWVDFPANGKWKKVLEATNLDGFNPKAKTFEAQLRIDGFLDKGKNVPTIHSSTVQEIAPKNK